jgi:tRNA pseudouridine55 synthase
MNEATKLIPFLRDDPKYYEGVLKIGEETDTDDLTGKTIRKGPCDHLSPEMIRTVFKSFIGRIRQIPPMFSAVKVKGRPLYRMARMGIEVEREEREVQIYDLQIENIALPMVYFMISCSKGTYIRALARDIGKTIGCGAHLISLRRTRSGPFTIEQALPLSKVKSFRCEEDLHTCFIPLKEALFDLPEMIGDDSLVRKVRFGREMVARDLDPNALPPFEEKQWLKMSSPEDGLVAILQSAIRKGDIGTVAPDRVVFRPIRVFHNGKELRKEESI